MKNKKSVFGLIFTIICNLSIVALFVVGFISIFKFNFPDRIDKDKFIEYMENKGCSIIDMQEKENYTGVIAYLITDRETCPYLVSYAIFDDYDRLEDFFYRTRKDVLQGNTNVRGQISIELNLFSEYYEYTTIGDYYKAVVYNDNSVLYVSVLEKYKTEAIDIFKDFNYKYKINFESIKIISYTLIILLFIFIISMWGIEKKIRNKGWISLIPFYNIGCLSKDILGSPWLALLLLVPIGNAIFMIYLLYNIGKVFNKSDVYRVLMIFFPTITLPLLAFDDSTYMKSEKKILSTSDNSIIKSDVDPLKDVTQKQ